DASAEASKAVQRQATSTSASEPSHPPRVVASYEGDGLIWNCPLAPHPTGEVSMALADGNVVCEDFSRVDVGSFGTLVGVFDGHGGPHAARFAADSLLGHVHRALGTGPFQEAEEQSRGASVGGRSVHDGNGSTHGGGGMCGREGGGEENLPRPGGDASAARARDASGVVSASVHGVAAVQREAAREEAPAAAPAATLAPGLVAGAAGGTTKATCASPTPDSADRITNDEQRACSAVLSAFASTEADLLALVRAAWHHRPELANTGTCALVAFFPAHGASLVVASLGDSRAVMGRRRPRVGGLLESTQTVSLSEEHNASQERERHRLQQNHPGDPTVVMHRNGAWRVKGIIQVTRSLGDFYLKHKEFQQPPLPRRFRLDHLGSPSGVALRRPLLRSDPSVVHVRVGEEDRFVILASDGLWEHVSRAEAVKMVDSRPRQGIAHYLARTAVSRAARKAGVTRGAAPVVERFAHLATLAHRPPTARRPRRLAARRPRFPRPSLSLPPPVALAFPAYLPRLARPPRCFPARRPRFRPSPSHPPVTRPSAHRPSFPSSRSLPPVALPSSCRPPVLPLPSLPPSALPSPRRAPFRPSPSLRLVALPSSRCLPFRPPPFLPLVALPSARCPPSSRRPPCRSSPSLPLVALPAARRPPCRSSPSLPLVALPAARRPPCRSSPSLPLVTLPPARPLAIPVYLSPPPPSHPLLVALGIPPLLPSHLAHLSRPLSNPHLHPSLSPIIAFHPHTAYLSSSSPHQLPCSPPSSPQLSPRHLSRSPRPLPCFPVSPAMLPPNFFPVSPYPLRCFPPFSDLLPPIPFPAPPRPLPCLPPSPSLLSPIPFPASPRPLPCPPPSPSLLPPSPSLLPPIPFPASPHPLPCFPPSRSLLPPIPFPASPHPVPCFPPSRSLLPPIPFPVSPHPLPCSPPSPSLLPPIPFPASPHPLPCFPPSPSLLPPIPFPVSPHPLPCFPPSPSLLPPIPFPASPHPLPCFPPSPSLFPPIPFPVSPHPLPCFPPSPSLLPPIAFPVSPHPLPCFPPSPSLLPPNPFPAVDLAFPLPSTSFFHSR
ncbi:unnamed protein product, partial [Closterium sp. Naga37s-1]